MSRIGGGDVVVVKPVNNIYTVMVVVAAVAQILALLIVLVRFKTAFGSFLFTS